MVVQEERQKENKYFVYWGSDGGIRGGDKRRESEEVSMTLGPRLLGGAAALARVLWRARTGLFPECHRISEEEKGRL